MDRNKGCDHLGIVTADRQRLAAFYVETLGFEIKREDHLEREVTKGVFGIDADCAFTVLAVPGLLLELFEPQGVALSDQIAAAPGYHHFGFCTDDRLTFVESLRSRGIEVITVYRHERPVFFVSDPDGNRIEIRE